MTQRQIRTHFVAGCLAAVVVSGCGGSSNAGPTTGNVGAGKVTQTNLVSDQAGAATVTDPNLVDAWGISYSPGGPFWIANNGTGTSTVYNGSGVNQGLVVTLPMATGSSSPEAASGNVYNGTNSFIIPASTKAIFMFDSEDGVISAWNSGTTAVKVVDNSASGAVYKGLAIGSVGSTNYLYATNFHADEVEVYDTNFNLVNQFTDPAIAGYAPFGIQNIGGMLYVTFALQNGAKHDDTPGPGWGYVDIFNPNGTLSKRLISQGALNAPWGLAVAPAGFGSVGGDLLVGNFGDGRINVYNISTGAFVGTLDNASGSPLFIDGLWALTFGNGGSAGSTGTLYFTAGPDAESHGLFGSLAPVP